MNIVEGEPNTFFLIIMEILEKLHIIRPPTSELSPEEEKDIITLMESKGFHFAEEDKKK